MGIEASRLSRAKAALVARTRRSQRLAEQRREVLNSGLAANLEMPHPIFIERGEGAYVFDADGNRYLDTSVGFGLHMLGHRHPAVERSIKARAALGWMFGIHTTSQMQLARLLHEASPCAERVVFCNTGTEATLYAIRAARGFSGRERVALFDGCYHGAHDYGLWVADPNSSVDAPEPLPMGRGVPAVLRGLTLLLPYRRRAAFDLVRRHRDDLALVMVEGVQSSNPQREVGEFLRELSEVCRACNVLFCIDEVITGFRVAYGGAQERFGVTPDLATYGKVLGGGLPVGAVAGRADLMEVFTGLGAERGIFSGGTFSGNPLTMEAGAAAVGWLRGHPQIYVDLEAAGNRLAAAVNAYAKAQGIPAQVKNVGSMFHLFLQGGPLNSMRDLRGVNAAAEKAFYLFALNRGVLVPGTQRAFLSAAHGKAEVDQLIEVFQESLADAQADGLFER